jgi:hypothetical protein
MIPNNFIWTNIGVCLERIMLNNLLLQLKTLKNSIIAKNYVYCYLINGYNNKFSPLLWIFCLVPSIVNSFVDHKTYRFAFCLEQFCQNVYPI